MMLKTLKGELKVLEIRFEGAGGRGCEEADEIDAHRAAVAILEGEDWCCHYCMSHIIPALPEQEARETLASKVLTQMHECGAFHPNEFGEWENEDE